MEWKALHCPSEDRVCFRFLSQSASPECYFHIVHSVTPSALSDIPYTTKGIVLSSLLYILCLSYIILTYLPVYTRILQPFILCLCIQDPTTSPEYKNMKNYEPFYLDKMLNLSSKTHPLRIYTRQDTVTWRISQRWGLRLSQSQGYRWSAFYRSKFLALETYQPPTWSCFCFHVNCNAFTSYFLVPHTLAQINWISFGSMQSLMV